MGGDLIIGAGFAGLAAGLEISKSGSGAIIVERGEDIGGLSRTFEIDGAKFEIGPHIYFDKNQEVFELWKTLLGDQFLRYDRKNSLYQNGKFFISPLKISNALLGIGVWGSIRILLSFVKSKFSLGHEYSSSKDWVVGNFGEELYKKFFKEYNEKIWGLPCEEISANWAGHRIKASLLSTVWSSITRNHKVIVKRYHFPQGGSEQVLNAMLEESLRVVGSECRLNSNVEKIICSENMARSVIIRDLNNGEETELEIDNLISTMPIDDLIRKLEPGAPEEIKRACDNLIYRDLRLVAHSVPKEHVSHFKDQWVDIHDTSILALRATNFGNYYGTLDDGDLCALTMEYNHFKDDEICLSSDNEMIELSKTELEKMGIVGNGSIRNSRVLRFKKSYPVYYKGYEEDIGKIRKFLSEIANLQTIGRSGMYKWNNMHHSVKTGLLAARNIRGEKQDLWSVQGMVTIGKG
jgi:protoporphyrinogen oxidase